MFHMRQDWARSTQPSQQTFAMGPRRLLGIFLSEWLPCASRTPMASQRSRRAALGSDWETSLRALPRHAATATDLSPFPWRIGRMLQRKSLTSPRFVPRRCSIFHFARRLSRFFPCRRPLRRVARGRKWCMCPLWRLRRRQLNLQIVPLHRSLS